MTFIYWHIVFIGKLIHYTNALRCGLSECPLYASCVSNTCVCPNVDDSVKIYEPVCGSNGFTYKNEMDLKDYSCNNNLHILIIHTGKCPQKYNCGSPMCHPESVCNTTTGKCECSPFNVSVSDVVCGTDGKEYKNKEQLLFTACVQRSNLKIATHSKCDERRRKDEDDDDSTTSSTVIVPVVVCLLVVIIAAVVIGWFYYQKRTKSKFTISKRDEDDFLTDNIA